VSFLHPGPLSTDGWVCMYVLCECVCVRAEFGCVLTACLPAYLPGCLLYMGHVCTLFGC